MAELWVEGIQNFHFNFIESTSKEQNKQKYSLSTYLVCKDVYT